MLPYFLMWFAMLAVAVANGALRELTLQCGPIPSSSNHRNERNLHSIKLCKHNGQDGHTRQDQSSKFSTD